MVSCSHIMVNGLLLLECKYNESETNFTHLSIAIMIMINIQLYPLNTVGHFVRRSPNLPFVLFFHTPNILAWSVVQVRDYEHYFTCFVSYLRNDAHYVLVNSSLIIHHGIEWLG